MILIFILLALLWLTFLAQVAWHGSAIKSLPDSLSVSDLPLLSVVIAARDEAMTLQESLPKLIATTYSNVEFILINDRSVDETEAILNKFANIDPRVRIITVSALPEGWLGKVHALNEGVKAAKGKWLLLSDADVHFEQKAFERAVSEAEGRSLDHLLLLPKMRVERSTFLLPLFNLCFGMMFVSRLKARDIAKSSSSAFGGVGAFNLIRRSVYDRSRGLEWLKLEVLDDVGVGLLMKEAGGRAAIFASTGEVHLEWYASFKQTILGLEKNAFAGFARFSALRALWMILFLIVVALGGLVIAVIAHSWLMILVYVFLYTVLPGIGVVAVQSDQGFRFWHGLFVPLGFLFIAYVLGRSAWKTLSQRGIYWRETFYPLVELRQGQRVKL